MHILETIIIFYLKRRCKSTSAVKIDSGRDSLPLLQTKRRSAALSSENDIGKKKNLDTKDKKKHGNSYCLWTNSKADVSSVTFEKRTLWQIFSESGNRSAWGFPGSAAARGCQVARGSAVFPTVWDCSIWNIKQTREWGGGWGGAWVGWDIFTFIGLK